MASPPHSRKVQQRRFAVGLRLLRLVDPTRTIRLPDGRVEPRTLVTELRYPAVGRPGSADLRDARAVRGAGPYPLVVFGHGFTVTPDLYARLLRTWAAAGYIVAAPFFPLENAHAPGGPDELDLINQPADMRFIISQLLSDRRFSGLLDPLRIAVAGQSDGGETALAVAYDRYYRDRRVRAAMILSGAEIPGHSALEFPPGGPPLLATQGTADAVNPPSFTTSFFDLAARPKFLLELFGAGHLGPYTTQQPQLAVIERVTTAFLDTYLRHLSGAARRLRSAGRVAGVAKLVALP